MPTVREVSEPLAALCTSVPSAGDGVCEICHGCPGVGFATCYSCEQVIGQVGHECRLIVPASLYAIPSQLHYNLRGYKDSPSARVRQAFSQNVGVVLARFLLDHGDCIRRRAGEWDLITTIPSSGGRVGEHPLVNAMRRIPWLFDQHETVLSIGTQPAHHNRASDDAYVAAPAVKDRRVLIVDDTFTTGSHAQSAASALAMADARVVAIVPMGRVITPAFSENVKTYWERQMTVPFTFASCCLEP